MVPETPAQAPAVLVQGPESARARGECAAALRRARSVVLTSHEKVDPDGAGSALALAAGLRSLGIGAVVAFPTPLPRELSFLPGADGALVVGSPGEVTDALRTADAFVALDSGSAGRLGALRAPAEACGTFLNIDHHVSNDGFGTHRWVDPAYAAAGVMAFEILCEMGVPLTRDLCLGLYTALVFDTGNFAYSNTDPRCHRMAATCIQKGVRPEEVTARLRRSRTAASWALTAEAIAGLRTSDDGALAWTALTRESLRRHGLGEEGTPQDLVEIPVSLAPTRIGFLLLETGEGSVRVSLRSRCPVGVHLIAARHGGGGHARAAGCTLRGTLEEAVALVRAEAGEALAAWSAEHFVPHLPPQDA